MIETFDYDLIDKNGINSLELPIRLDVGSFFECYWGRYVVIETPKEYGEHYQNIVCERIEK
ncbi:hypothetical protein [Pleomorphovibrio marinus]|uniref:hypothetical protein n=1 Tax=Pleomorphovibrio marinus TaxID=2164132 RepID=UPI000E0C48E3|nr:hypothetical protein [Pleomorphovibrio marinus]